MAQESITVLGESLLARQKKDNSANYNRQRKEAYKIALAQGGIELINRNLVNNINGFLTQEPVMAAAVKQRRGVEDANFFLQEEERINSSGLNTLDYYTNSMLPTAQQLAAEKAEAAGIDPRNYDGYAAYVRDVTRQLAQERAAKYEQGLSVAKTIESPEDFAAFAALQNNKPTSVFQAITGKVGQMFSGKDRKQLDQEALNAIVNSDAVKRAETVSSLRSVFSSTGDLSSAIKVGEAIESGLITPGQVVKTVKPLGEVIKKTNSDGSISQIMMFAQTNENGDMVADRSGRPVYEEIELDRVPPGGNTWDLLGGGLQTVTGPLGEDVQVVNMIMTGPNGKPIVGDDGYPIILTQTLGADVQKVSGSLSAAMKSLSEEDLVLQTDTFKGLLNPADETTVGLYNTYLEQMGYKVGDEVNESLVQQKIAGQAKLYFELPAGLPQSESQKLMSQIFLDRLRATPEVEYGGLFGTGISAKTSLDMGSMSFSGAPNSLEVLSAITSLEGTANAIVWDSPEQVLSIMPQLSEEFSTLAPEHKGVLLDEFATDPSGRYALMFTPNEFGETPYSVLEDISKLDREPVTDIPEVQTVIDEVDKIVEPTPGDTQMLTTREDVERYITGDPLRGIAPGEPDRIGEGGQWGGMLLNRELLPQVESVKELRNNKSFQDDAKAYLMYMYGGASYKEDIVETIRDEINSPIVGSFRVDENTPPEIVEARDRLVSQIQEAPFGSFGEWLVAAKDNGIDAVTDPEMYLTALAFLGGGRATAGKVMGRVPGQQLLSKPAPKPATTAEPVAPAGRTTADSLLMGDRAQATSVARQRQWEAQMNSSASRASGGKTADNTQWMEPADFSRLWNQTEAAGYMSAKDIAELSRKVTEAGRYMSPKDISDLSKRISEGANYMSPRDIANLSRRVNKSSVNKQNIQTQQKREAEAREYVETIFGRHAIQEDITNYIQRVYGGKTVGKFNIRAK